MKKIAALARDVVWSTDGAVALLLFVFSFVLYQRTLAPDIVGADSAEFQFVPYVLGIAHPPGYPLYTILGKLFTFLPFGSVAFRMNVMSAFFAALAVALSYLTIVTVVRGKRESGVPAFALAARASAVVGAGLLMVAATWWGQATIAAVRTLNGFFVVLAVLLAFQWARTGDRKWLGWLAFCLGLSVTHHISMYTLLPAFVVFVLVVDWRAIWGWGKLWGLVWRFCLPLLILLYLPLRSAMGASFDAAKPTTLDAFFNLILARGFAGDMFYFGWADLPDRIGMLRELILAQFDLPALILSLLGLIFCVLRVPRLALLLILAAGTNVVISVTYKAPVIIDYLIPCYIVLAILAGLGVWCVARLVAAVPLGRFTRVLAPCLAVAALVFPVFTGVGSYSSLDLSGYTSLRAQVEDAYARAEPGSIVLADWHDSAALWYGQYAEDKRSDLDVRYVYPEGDSVPWARRAAESLAVGTVYLTDYIREVAAEYRLRRVGGLLQVLPGPSFDVPDSTSVEGYTPLNAVYDGKVKLLGYALTPTQAHPGEKVRLTLYWQGLQQLDASYKVFVHLAGVDGTIWGQRDGVPAKWNQPTEKWVPGEVVMDEYDIFLFTDTPPGPYRVVVGMYDVPEPGKWHRLPVRVPGVSTDAEFAELSALNVLSLAEPKASPQFTVDHDFGGVCTLRGYDVYKWQGTSLGLSLYWQPLKQIDENLAVFWSVRDGTGSVLAQGAGIPAEGAYATSRWSTDHLVVDLHDIKLDANPSGDLVVEVKLMRDVGGVLTDVDSSSGPARLALPASLNSVQKMRVNFGDKVLLKGWELDSATATPGGKLRVTLDWEPLDGMLEDCSTFVHLLGADGKVWAQHDGVPVAGAYPTLRWVRGRSLRDTHVLELPAGIPPGEYKLQVGMYVMRTSERWPVLNRVLADVQRDGQVETVRVGPVKVGR